MRDRNVGEVDFKEGSGILDSFLIVFRFQLELDK
jgi:hypothetical protein